MRTLNKYIHKLLKAHGKSRVYERRKRYSLYDLVEKRLKKGGELKKIITIIITRRGKLTFIERMIFFLPLPFLSPTPLNQPVDV